MTIQSITFDNAPVATKFGQRRVVFDGVVMMADGKVYRVNISATRGGRNPETTLRYSSRAKLGQRVPDEALPAVRDAVTKAATVHLADYRAAFVAKAQATDAAYMASLPKSLDDYDFTIIDPLPDYGQDMGAGHNGTPIEPAPVSDADIEAEFPGYATRKPPVAGLPLNPMARAFAAMNVEKSAPMSIKVFQDGRDFYLYSGDGETVDGTIEAPFVVTDMDSEMAAKARVWFETIYCLANGLAPEWEAN